MVDWETVVPLGQVVMTRGVLSSIPEIDLYWGTIRHAMGDWGQLSEFDQNQNNLALVGGGRLLSRYVATNGRVFWIITEADRSQTTILLPNEY